MENLINFFSKLKEAKEELDKIIQNKNELLEDLKKYSLVLGSVALAKYIDELIQKKNLNITDVENIKKLFSVLLKKNTVSNEIKIKIIDKINKISKINKKGG